MASWRDILTQLVRRLPLGSLVKYMALGGLAAGISLGIIVFLVEMFNTQKSVAGAIAIVVSLLLNFVSARWIVFVREVRPKLIPQFMSFIAVSGAMKLAEYCAYLALITFTPLHYALSYLGALIVSNLLKFEIYRKHIF